MLKVGDWVRFKHTPHMVSKIVEFHFDGICNTENGYEIEERHLELWQPLEGEWCWNKEKGLVKIIEQLDTTSYLCKIAFKVHYKGVVLSSEFEPFMGYLPSFIES